VRPDRRILFLLFALALPGLWLAVTTPLDSGRSVMLVLGVVLSGLVMMGFAWRAHRSGALLANRCATCGHAMCYTRPGEVKPPAGSSVTKECFWRCRRCGRLV